MGRTAPTFREIVEKRIRDWKKFRKALRREAREAFDKMMDAPKRYSSAGSQASRPEPFESIAMSILLEHERKLEEIEGELKEVRDDLGEY